MARIRLDPGFWRADGGADWPGGADPRRADFAAPEVAADIGARWFAEVPDALWFSEVPVALWCAVYLSLAKARGSECRLLAPVNADVRGRLGALGLFHALRDGGVEVDGEVGDGGADFSGSAGDGVGVVLPLTRFRDEGDVDELTNRANDALSASNLGAANLYPIVRETFSEIAMNAAQHSESPIGAYGVIQFQRSERGQSFVCGVADGGIGIRRSLGRNPAHPPEHLRDDWTAIEYAMNELVSGTGNPYRGIGLFGIMEDAIADNQSVIIRSGLGSLFINDENAGTGAMRTSLFPGTLACVSIPA